MRWFTRRPTTPRRSPGPATSAATPPAQGTPPATSPETSRGRDASFTAVAPATAGNYNQDSGEPPVRTRGLLKLFACSGKRPNSPPETPRVSQEITVAPIATPRATWAQHREVEAVQPFGCGSGSGLFKKAFGNPSASATRKVADRQRERRRGANHRSSIEAGSMPAETPNSTTSMLRSQSAPPLAILDDGLVVDVRIPETPSQASPLESDVPRPALFSCRLCPSEEVRSAQGIGFDASTLKMQPSSRRPSLVDQIACRPGSAPPVVRSPHPEAVPSPCKLSPGVSVFSPAQKKPIGLPKGKLSPANSTSPSSIPPLPAVPLWVGADQVGTPPVPPPPVINRRLSSPYDKASLRLASPLGVPKRTSRTASPATAKRSQSPADFLKAMVSQQPMDIQNENVHKQAWKQDTTDQSQSAATPHSWTKQEEVPLPQAVVSQEAVSLARQDNPPKLPMRLTSLETSPTDTDCSGGSPNLLQLLQRQGQWPPPDSGKAEDWASPVTADKPSLNAPCLGNVFGLGESPIAAEDKRSKEAQELLANMLTGSAPAEARRRHGSAPPLGSRVHDAALILDSPLPTNTTVSARGSTRSIGRIGIPGNGCSTASRREATAPPLRPINGSMPDFPPAEKIL